MRRAAGGRGGGGYFVDGLARRVKQGQRRAVAPLAVAVRELQLERVADDRGHDDGALAPRRREGVGKLVVLDVLVVAVSLRPRQRAGHRAAISVDLRTIDNWPPLRWFATALAIDGFSATQRIRPGMGERFSGDAFVGVVALGGAARGVLRGTGRTRWGRACT